jgi:hypothetical protein
VADAKLYTEKTAITAADMLNDRVVPFFDEEGIPLMLILTDRGTEYCGTLENHAYELFLSTEGIDHTKYKAYTPQTNVICERLHKTVKNEFYDSALRKKIYTSLEDLQTDVDVWLRHYNRERPHSGRYCCGKTPMQTFRECKDVAVDKTNQLAYDKGAFDSCQLSLLRQPGGLEICCRQIKYCSVQPENFREDYAIYYDKAQNILPASKQNVSLRIFRQAAIFRIA